MNKTMLTTLAAGVLSLGLAGQSAMANEIISMDKNFSSPIVKLQGYNKVYLHDLDLSNAKVISPPWVDKDSFRWEVEEKELNFLQEQYKKGMLKALTANGGKYKIVEKEGKGVLSVDVEIVSFMPYAEKNAEGVKTKGTGEFHLSVQLRDGASGSLIQIVEGTQAIGDDYNSSSRESRMKDANNLFLDWGNRLRQKLDEQSK